MSNRPSSLSRLILPVVWLALSACRENNPAPDLTGLSLGLGYDDIVDYLGSRCEHRADSGVRGVLWTYEDGSSLEVGIYQGTLSGLTARGHEAERRAAAVRSEETPADSLHVLFGDEFTTLEDTSDRECLWRWDDGRLVVTMARGVLREAIWFPTEGGDAVMLAEVQDEAGFVLAGLRSELPSERFRALTTLSETADPRLADALIEFLRTETEKTNRGKAAVILARLGDTRAAPLLLGDLEALPLNPDVLKALGAIGDMRTDAALRQALHREGSYRLKSEVQKARAAIRRRHGAPPPDRS